MVRKFFEFLFGCRHKRLTRPITPVHRSRVKAGHAAAYVVCLDCGKQFHYDPVQLCMGAPIAMAATGSADAWQRQY